MKNKLLYYILLLPLFIFSQEQDSISTTHHLKEVVVTGQLEPQSLKKSVHNVRVISKEDIKQQAATNLSDVLNQYLNITIIPSSSTGRSSVSLFGLDGSYFKILVDNVPIVSDNTLGNSIDLTQINLDDIERIEIIEGSMGVTHGANAVSGILNIITKKSSKNKWEIKTGIQEETVGSEFALFNKGKHIQNIKVTHTINSNWFASVNFNRNDFKGFLDDKKGENYTESDGLRGFVWLPKEQYFASATTRYKNNNFRAFYRFNYLNETISYYNPTIVLVANPPFGTNKFTNDRRYLSQRFYHHLNLNGKLFSLRYNISISHQKQTRNNEYFTYNFQENREQDVEKTKLQESEVLYSTGTISDFFKSEKMNFQLGYEFVNTKGFSLVDGENQTLNPVSKQFNNYDLFVVSEINFTPTLSVRPGTRVSFQSQFKTQYAASLGIRKLLANNYEIRASLGKSYRVPTFEELYSKIKFSGHQFYGNENLIPEKSTSYELSLKKIITNDAIRLKNKVSIGYLQVKDRIDMAFVGYEDTTPVYQYININKYKMWNVTTNNTLKITNFKLSLGAILVGISQVHNDGEAVSDDKFLYNLQMNSSLAYSFKKTNTTLALYYKYMGKHQQFQRVTENGEALYRLSEIESYSFLDASLQQPFFKDRLELTLGARNILNVTNISQGVTGNSVHASSSNIALGYGRSYFFKLMYNLNF